MMKKGGIDTIGNNNNMISGRISDNINVLGSRLHLTEEIIHATEYIYSRAKEVGLLRGRDTYVVLAAAAYIACKQIGAAKTMTDFTSILHIGRKEMARNYRLIISKLSLTIPTNDPFILLDQITNKCKVGEQTRRQANILMNYSLRNDFHLGKNPMSIAGSVLYIACETASDHRSQKVIAQAAGITSVTLANRVKDLKNLLCNSGSNNRTLLKDINTTSLVSSFNSLGSLN
jgi:transcription initiation factor TFIIB